MNNTATSVTAAYRACPAVPGDRDKLADRAVSDACDLVISVRELDPREVWGTLAIWARDEPERLFAAVVALAAMVPTDRTCAELLGWTYELAGRC